MSIFKVEIKPFDIDGNYTEFQDITSDVDLGSFSSISQQLDNSEYNVGVFRFSSFNIGVRNQNGKFSEAGETNSIFQFKRSDSILKVSWREKPEAYCGTAVTGVSALGEFTEVFQGLLNDESAATSINVQNLSFAVLGLESIFSRVIVNFASLSAGDTFETIIETILNQTEITKVLTVDASNISVGVNVATDAIADFEDKTVKEALDDLLLLSNSVLYIENATVFVKPRTAGATVEKTFFGQSSSNGIEDALDIFDIRAGQNKMFNYWKWANTSVVVTDTDSINANGVRKKDELDYSYITNSTKQDNILDSLLAEFKDPKTELKILTPLTYETLALGFLDRVAIDYPPVAYGGEGDIPIYGLAVYGASFYPISQFSLTLDPDEDQFKIMGKKVDTKFGNITLSLRRI